ncbi:MAG: hypothetical protein EBS56_11560 [Planctomycetia bacterium]|nr:hypothetical protein [Planctomycetia bacterium]
MPRHRPAGRAGSPGTRGRPRRLPPRGWGRRRESPPAPKFLSPVSPRRRATRSAWACPGPRRSRCSQPGHTDASRHQAAVSQ